MSKKDKEQEDAELDEAKEAAEGSAKKKTAREPKDLEHVTMEEAEYWCELFGVEPDGLKHALKVSGSDNPDVIRQFILGT